MKKISLLFIVSSFLFLSCVEEAKIPILLPTRDVSSQSSISSSAATIELVLTPSELTFGGRSTITATVKEVSTFGESSVKDGTIVTFTLDNAALGTISPFVTTSGGVATALFTAGRTTPGQTNITAKSGSATSNPQPMIVTAPTSGSIEFLSASPQVIGIKGSGHKETSAVTFIVRDVQGNLVLEGTSVDFKLSGPRGGEYIGTSSGQLAAQSSTNSRGEATVILNSGSAAGPVTIIASVTVKTGTTTVATFSSSSPTISIGGGVVSATHFDLATTRFNLPGLVFYGAEAKILAFVADRFGNFNVLEGTSISFSTEAGAIDLSGRTDKTGFTSVVLRTQAPAPAQVDPIIPPSPSNGHVTVLATVMGEEGFTDTNGNRQYDAGEDLQDLPEPFLDLNNDGFYTGSEPFFDIDQNKSHSKGNSVWDGPGCTQASCQQSIMLFATIELAFTGGPTKCEISPQIIIPPTPAEQGRKDFKFTLGDKNNNSLVSGTKITITTTTGEIDGVVGDIVNGKDVTIGDKVGGPTVISFSLLDDNAVSSTPVVVTVNVTGVTAENVFGCAAVASGTI